MARIKHIAIRTPHPEQTAAFYKDVFGLKEVGQARAVYLSDGYINLAILRSRTEDTGESRGTRRGTRAFTIWASWSMTLTTPAGSWTWPAPRP